MDFYSTEQWEIMGDALEEIAEWNDFEADMAKNPYNDPNFSW